MENDLTVGDFVTLQRGTTYKGNLVGKPGPALLGLGSIQPGGGFRDGDYKTYGGDCPPKLMLYPGDIFVSLKGATKDGKMIGSVARVPVSVPSGRLTQDTVKLEFRDPDRRNGDFLYWILRTPQYRDYCAGRATGSAVVALSREDFLSYQVPAKTPARMHIVKLLGTLDDLIELNRETNAILEEMARALFKSWFVDFDPVRAKLEGRPPAGMDAETAKLFPDHFQDSELGQIPRGWVNSTVGDICEINGWTLGKNDNLETLEYVEISEVNRGNIANMAIYHRGDEPSRARRRLRHGDTVLSTVRPDRGAYFLALNPPANRVASTGFAVLTPSNAPWSFVHAAMTQPEISDHLGHLADGGAYPAVRPEIISAIEVAIPNTASILGAFHQLCAPLFEVAESNRLESRDLATLRDTLLPKLLSGELSVPAAEELIAASA